MKKILLFGLLLAVVLMGGCQKDDNSDNAPADIVGKWYIKKMVDVEYENGVKVDESTETTFTTKDFMEFKSNGTAVFSSDGGPDPADIDNFTYTRQGDKVVLTLTGSTDVTQVDIKKLTTNELVLFIDETDTYQGKTYRYTSELTLSK